MSLRKEIERQNQRFLAQQKVIGKLQKRGGPVGFAQTDEASAEDLVRPARKWTYKVPGQTMVRGVIEREIYWRHPRIIGAEE